MGALEHAAVDGHRGDGHHVDEPVDHHVHNGEHWAELPALGIPLALISYDIASRYRHPSICRRNRFSLPRVYGDS